jgi:dGTPase
MSEYRLQLEQREHQLLSAAACFSDHSSGRLRAEPDDPMRTCFQRDRDRVLHCKSFRRLAQKTQVLLSPAGDHYRTRITHTLEVSQIARTISRALQLNEDLTEAIALAHDLGHTPFGHAGEAALNHLVPGGFHHVRQSLRVVDVLEKEGRGLNLTHEVREGIAKHSKGKGTILSEKIEHSSSSLEGQVVRVADIIAYLNHDLDDAIRAQLLSPEEVPPQIQQTLGRTHSQRISAMIQDVLAASQLEKQPLIRLSAEGDALLKALREFLYQRVYDNPIVHGELVKAEALLASLWDYFLGRGRERFVQEFWPAGLDPLQPMERAVADFLAGMTDRYAIRLYEEVFVPHGWSVL